MKVNKLWIPMIIFGIIGGVAKLCDTVFNVNGVGFFVNSDICSAVFIISIVLVWFIGIIMVIADRKTDISLSPPKSKITGFFGFLAAVSVLGNGIMSVFSLGSSTNLVGGLTICGLSLLGGGVMLYESSISLTGHNGMTKFPLLGIVLPCWACGRLITLFMEYSKVSIHATEMFDVISVIFLMFFLFYQAMFFAEAGTRNAVLRSTLYGICYVMCGLITTADVLIKMFSPTPQTGAVDVLVIEPTIGRILTCVEDLSFVLYATAFVISNARHAKVERAGGRDMDDEDDPEFLGAISSERKPKKDGAPKNSGARRSKEGIPVKSKGILGVDEDDYDENDNNDNALDFSNLKKAMNDVNSAADEGTPAIGRLSFEDDDTEPAPLTFDSVKDIEPAPMTFDSVKDIEPAPMTFESVKDIEPAPMTFESVKDIEPAPMTFESVKDIEPAPMTFESVKDIEPAPMTFESIRDTEPAAPAAVEEIKAPEPVQAEPETPVSEPEPETDEFDFNDDNMFEDEDGDEDYEEIFRLLDEMGNDD